VPYFKILEDWIYKGVVDDPYSEFMVEVEPGESVWVRGMCVGMRYVCGYEICVWV